MKPRSQPGFTMVELLIALGLTAVVATGLYALAAISSQTFQTQERIAQMQSRLRLAMDMVRSDLSRAGYLSSPNAQVDPMVCPRPTGLSLQTLILERDTRPTNWPAQNTQSRPVRLTLIGNYQSADEYPIQGVVGQTVYLQNHTPAFTRVPDAATFQRLFVGSVVRLRGADGRMQFGTVTTANFVPATTEGVMPTLQLAAAPLIAGGAAGTGTAGCGLTGFATGATIAPVSAVRYRIQDASAQLSGAVNRNAMLNIAKTDLTREDLQLTSGGFVSVANSLQLAMDYAVDFDLAGIFDVSAPGAAEPTLQRLAFGDATNEAWLADARTSVSARPHRLRGLSLRISTRSPTEDQEFSWVTPSLPTDPLTRFKVVAASPYAARVRSLQSELLLPNVNARTFQ